MPSRVLYLIRAVSILLLAFESAASAGGKFDGEFCAGFFSVEFEGQLDEAIDELRIGQAGSFPQLGIHADGCETRNRVEFVDEDFSICAIQEEIAASHTGSVNRAEGANGVILKCGDLFLG